MRPDAVHHLARLTGVALANGHDHQVMKDAFGGQVDVDDLRQRESHQRQKDALDRLAHPRVLHGRLAHDGRRVDRVFAVRDAGDVEDGILLFHGVEAGVVAEGALGAQLVELHVAFEDDLGMRGHFEIDGLALHQLDRLLAQESGDDELLDLRRRGHDGGEGGRGIGADGDGDLQAVILHMFPQRDASVVCRRRFRPWRSTCCGGCRSGLRRAAARVRCSAAFFWRCQCMPVVWPS